MTLVGPDKKPVRSEQLQDADKRLATAEALLLACFGALKGFIMTTSGVRLARDREEFLSYQEMYATKIYRLLGAERIEQHWGISTREVQKGEERITGEDPGGVH